MKFHMTRHSATTRQSLSRSYFYNVTQPDRQIDRALTHMVVCLLKRQSVLAALKYPTRYLPGTSTHPKEVLRGRSGGPSVRTVGASRVGGPEHCVPWVLSGIECRCPATFDVVTKVAATPNSARDPWVTFVNLSKKSTKYSLIAAI